MLWTGLAAGSLLLGLVCRAFGWPAATPAAFPLIFYQQVVGRLDGRACPSWPVCSRYARQAVAAHGLLFGSWLALDRLIHEADDLHRGPWVRDDGVLRLYDPLRRNDFWLKAEERKDD
ncbi:MAG: membrane protein insertion efficiency factor YidD [Mariprofundaceae bacterium]